MSLAWQIVAGLLPSIGVGWLFYKIMKAIIEGDRNERLAQSRWEAAQDAAQANSSGEHRSTQTG